MSQRRTDKERKPRPWEQDKEGNGASFGAWLKRQREIREISLREISDVTKINLRYLEALEQDRFSVLPAEVFARGFLREYAKYVGLDPDEVVNHFRAAQQDSEPEHRTPDRPPSRLHSSTQWVYGLVLTAGVLALFGVVALVSFWAERRAGSESSPPPIAAPVFTSPPSSVAASAESRSAPLEVTLDFTENCWVEAVLDGRERLSELRVQGESLRLTASNSVSLTLGNVGGVRIEVNGRPLEVAGGKDVVRDLEITLDSLQGGAEARNESVGPSL